MINGLKQLKNLSIPQRLIRARIIELFQAKIKLGRGSRTTESASCMTKSAPADTAAGAQSRKNTSNRKLICLQRS